MGLIPLFLKIEHPRNSGFIMTNPCLPTPTGRWPLSSRSTAPLVGRGHLPPWAVSAFRIRLG